MGLDQTPQAPPPYFITTLVCCFSELWPLFLFLAGGSASLPRKSSFGFTRPYLFCIFCVFFSPPQFVVPRRGFLLSLIGVSSSLRKVSLKTLSLLCTPWVSGQTPRVFFPFLSSSFLGGFAKLLFGLCLSCLLVGEFILVCCPTLVRAVALGSSPSASWAFSLRVRFPVG